MDPEKKATETVVPPIATEPEDLEAKNVALEAEKVKLLEEKENYRKAYLKQVEKNKENPDPEGDEERLRQIAREELANSRIVEIAAEQDAIIKKALKENKELKLAQLNKTTTPPAAVGTHAEAPPVRDGLITAEQEKALRDKGFNDKDIERYKKNLQRNR